NRAWYRARTPGKDLSIPSILTRISCVLLKASSRGNTVSAPGRPILPGTGHHFAVSSIIPARRRFQAEVIMKHPIIGGQVPQILFGLIILCRLDLVNTNIIPPVRTFESL
ncbi:MAG TPA: hypothetical protein PLR12_06480, partial [Clostridia bacterium]|nr:hypothetical protein [Clostridia bacterium]